MKVLLTGAFGNIGSNTLRELIKQGHQVTCLDLKNKATLRSAKRFKDKVKLLWGDVRNREDIAVALKDQDVVIHLAAIIPPRSEMEPQLAEDTNIGGTRNLIEALKGLADPPRLIFTSSVSVFGRKFNEPPPRRVGESLQPSDNYSRHKIICEEMITQSGLEWSILRCPAMPSLQDMGLDPIMFKISLDTRIEFLDPRDAGLALANAASSEEVWGKILLLGGGPDCQFSYCDYVGKTLEAVGIGRLPCEAFGPEPFYTDWMDSEETQRILQYQRHSLDDYLETFKANLGFKRHLISLLRPLVRRAILKHSPYLPPGIEWGRKRPSYWQDKVALVTGASSGIGESTARCLAAKGLKVALVARRKHKLEEVADKIEAAGGEAMVIAADLTDESDRLRVVEEVRAKWGKIDVLINNAGFAWYGYGADMPWDVASKMIELNVRSLVHLTLLVIRRMRSYNSGHIINVGSIAGSFPQQGVMLYSATKSFIDSFTTSLYREMRGTNVHVSVIKPGAVATELFRVAERQPGGFRVPAESLAVSPDSVAVRIWGVLNRPRRLAYVPRFLWVVPWVELAFGWFIDLLGPLLLRRSLHPVKTALK